MDELWRGWRDEHEELSPARAVVFKLSLVQLHGQIWGSTTEPINGEYNRNLAKVPDIWNFFPLSHFCCRICPWLVTPPPALHMPHAQRPYGATPSALWARGSSCSSTGVHRQCSSTRWGHHWLYQRTGASQCDVTRGKWLASNRTKSIKLEFLAIRTSPCWD